MDFPFNSFHITPPFPDNFSGGAAFYGVELIEKLATSNHSSILSSPISPSMTTDEIISALGKLGMQLYVPRQVHGDVIVTPRWNGLRDAGDAVIVDRSDIQGGRAIGVFTADCVPAIFWTEDQVAIVHAGWKGLASRILSKTVAQLGSPVIQCAIGPCAGPDRYEVGAEVIAVIGDTARIKPKSELLYLDLAETAIAELSSLISEKIVWKADICTISDTRFYSYRRQGPGSGRNLTIVYS